MFSNCLVFLEWFAPCLEILYSILFGAVCSLFSNFLVSAELFAPRRTFSNLVRAACSMFSFSSLSRAVSFSYLFRAVRSLCSQAFFSIGFLSSKSPASFERFAPCSYFLNSLVYFERFAPCYQIL